MNHSEAQHRTLISQAGLLSLMTLASRVLGMARDVVCASVFGTGVVWDAFIYAFTIPNFLRRVLGEGALSSVFIPVYAEVLKKEGKSAANRLINNTLTILALALGLLSGLVIGALQILRWSGFLEQKGLLIVTLLIILFPYILFLSLYAVAMAVLQCGGHFFIPALAPVALNVIWILSVLFICPLFGQTQAEQITVLAWCILGAGAFQFCIQVFQLLREGVRIRWVFDPFAAAIKRIVELLIPATLGFAVVQVNFLIDLSLAFFLGAGANSSLWYGNRLIQFPLGIIAIAMGTALLPKLSEQAVGEKSEELVRTLAFSLKTVFILILPASAGLIALRVPIIQLLFERGAFDAVSTARCARTLFAYGLGLFAFSGLKVMGSAFYACQDTRTPVKVGTFCVLLNFVLNLILMVPFREAGLAFATTLSAALNFAVQIYIFDRHRSKIIGHYGIFSTLAKSAVASFVMALLASYIFARLGGTGGGLTPGLIRLCVTMCASVAIYFLTCLVLKLEEANRLVGWVRYGGREATGKSS